MTARRISRTRRTSKARRTVKARGGSRSAVANGAKISIQEMLDQLPRGCLGEFDFISALLYVDCTQAEHEALVAKRQELGSAWATDLSEREKLLIETLMHEYFHYLQVLSSGYVFETVAALLDVLEGTLNRFQQDDDDYRRLAVFGRLADRILRPLGEPGPSSALSPLDLLEGAAYYFQSRVLERATDHDSMLAALAMSGVGPEYTRAYERASLVLGDYAFPTFLPCVGSALLFVNPPAVFEALLEHIAEDQASPTPSHFGQVFKTVFDKQREHFIGSAVDVRELRKAGTFPWYEDALSQVAKSEGPPPVFFEFSDDAVLRALNPPMAFRDSFRGDLGIQAMFALMASRSSLRFTLPYTGAGTTEGV